MKKTFRILLSMVALAAMTFAVSCSEDDQPDIDDIIKGGTDLASGIYIVGNAVSADTTKANKLVQGEVNGADFGKQEREGFFEAYVYMGSGSFSFLKVDGETITEMGGSYSDVVDGDPEELNIYVGTYTDGGAAATSPVTGQLVHVSLDVSTGQYVIIPVNFWEVIGGATPDGWTSGTKMELKSASADKVEFEGKGIELRAGEMKFRFDSNWSMNLEEGECDVKVTACLNYFTNFGGTLTELVAGGSNIQFGDAEGLYTISLVYTPGEGNSITVTLTKTGDVEPLPEYPAELHMIGGSIGGWDWVANGIKLVPTHSNPHLFWRVVYLSNEGVATADQGFKFAPQAEWKGDFGKNGDATNGIFAKGSENVPVPAAGNGYYIIVVNLETETIEVAVPGIFGIGDAFGSFDAANSAYQFTVNNTDKLITFSPIAADSDLRIHVAASTLAKAGSTDPVDWWQAEFVILNGVIEYRGTGGDQARLPVTVGQTISLDFIAGTGSAQ